MREIIRWWGIRVGAALLLGTIMAVLTGSAVLGAVVTGLVVWAVASVAWDARRNRGNTAYGNRLRCSGGAADGVPYAGAGGVGPGTGDGCGGGFDGGGGFGGGDGGGGGC